MNEILTILGPLTPAKWDKNEIYVIAIMILVCGVFILIHKRSPIMLQTEIICLYVFNVWFATVGDRIFAEPPLDFYDTLDYGHGELFDSILQIFVYPIPSILALHFLIKYKPNKFFFIFLTACILSGLEWVSVQFFNLFQYKNWNILYSFMFYCFAIILNIIYYQKISKVIKKRFIS